MQYYVQHAPISNLVCVSSSIIYAPMIIKNYIFQFTCFIRICLILPIAFTSCKFIGIIVLELYMYTDIL